VLFGLLAGEELAGVAGIFLSVPVIAAAKIVVLRITQARKLETKQNQGSAASSPVERPLIAPAERDKDVPPHA
jgi:predicted PurR-regulated permease PerM